MINIIKIIGIILLYSQCSSLPDPKTVFLKDIAGQWKTSSDSVNWFKRLNPSVNIINNTVIDVASNGNFTIGGVIFTFIEIEKDGMLAVYNLVNGSSKQYVGIGFAHKDDTVLVTNPVNTIEQVISIKKGNILLQK